ncbi:MAG TPA: PHP domain-containing protein [Patescibacteria group bacterium]|nr:PHP domain-containing protein [Patescibacteria group bacterium]
MTNHEVAKLLRNVAAAYSIKDEKKYLFQLLAYQKAADAIAHLPTELGDLLKEEEKIPGIGTSIRAHLVELYKNGHFKHFDEITSMVPASVFPLLDVTSLGPKKAYKLVTALNLNNPKTVYEDLKKAAIDGRIAELETFGEKSQTDIIRALDEFSQGKIKSNRMPLPYAFELAKKIEAYLRKDKNTTQVFPLGSLRRMRDTIGDLDFAVATTNPEESINHFVNYPNIERIIERGPTSSSILVTGGRQVDLIAQTPETFGSLLQHFTGSKYHNVALREYSLKKNFSLSEKGIKLLKEKDQPVKTFEKEEAFYNFLGLDWIPPEIRENKGEIEAALRQAQGKLPGLPKLVELKDIKGDLHIHSSYPIEPSHDMGQNTMQNMLDYARKLGYEYLAFSEHHPSTSNHTKEQIISIMKRRFEYIEQIKKSNKSIRVINMLELDILPSGDLAIDDEALEYVDGAIVSIHSVFKTPKEKMTERVLKGLSHPKAKILAHPSGRLINQRDGYQLDYDKIFKFCVENNKAIEINAWPTRLDLVDSLVFEARELGVKFVIDTDSHATDQMDHMFYGVSVARRGWCEKKDILNSLPYEDFYKWLLNK